MKNVFILTVALLTILLVSCGDPYEYTPEKFDQAVAEGDFEKVHKILNGMKKENKYMGEVFNFFGPNGESVYKKESRKAFTAEIAFLVGEGAFDRIESTATFYPEVKDELGDILKAQSSNIYRHINDMDMIELTMLCKYLPPSSIISNYVSRKPSNFELIQLLRNIPFESESPITGHVEDPQILAYNQSIILGINKYNEAIDAALEYAISIKDKSLCKEILSLYKQNIDQQLTNRHTFSNDEYEVRMSDYPRERAKQRIIDGL